MCVCPCIVYDTRTERPTRCYTIVYWNYDSLNMFRATVCPSSGARDRRDVHSMWRMTLVMVGRRCCVWLSVVRAGWDRVEQHPSTRTHNLQAHATLTTNHNQSYAPHAVNICTVSSSWWWAYRCPKRVKRIISSINYCVASSWSHTPHIRYNHLILSRKQAI